GDEDEFGEGGPSIEPKTNPDLEKAIFANADDVEARLVYADWLQSAGDPRGELIVVQHGLSSDPTKKDLKKREAEILEKHAASLLGPLRKFATTADGEAEAAFTWSLGFIKTARFAWDYYANDDQEVDLAEATAALIAHPSGRFVESITLGINRADP